MSEAGGRRLAIGVLLAPGGVVVVPPRVRTDGAAAREDAVVHGARVALLRAQVVDAPGG